MIERVNSKLNLTWNSPSQYVLILSPNLCSSATRDSGRPAAEPVQCADVLQSETPLVQLGLALFQALSAAFLSEIDADGALSGTICSVSEGN